MPATNPLTYNGYVAQIAALAIYEVTTVAGVTQGVDAPFNAVIPQMLNYAELRIQRDLDLLPSLTSRSYTLTAGSNVLTIPIDDFVTVQTVSAAGQPLLPVSKEYLQNVYGDPGVTGIPVNFAMIGGDQSTGGGTSTLITVGPYPASNYAVGVTGTQRLSSLYKNAVDPLASTATTFISAQLPDLLLMASMVFMTGYQRNFSATSSDPQMGPNYENQYQALMRGAGVEEARKRFAASAWSSMSPAPVATPGR